MADDNAAAANGITPEVAGKILSADFGNIVRKVKAGKPLTSTERARVQALATGSGDALAVAQTTVELARALGVSRRTLSNWRKLPGAPTPASNGTHNVTAWRDFVRANNLKGSESMEGVNCDSLKARKLLAEVEDRELRVAIKKGEYVKLSDVRQTWLSVVGQAVTLLRSKFENELPPILSGLDAQAIRDEACKAVDEVCQLLHEGQEGGKVHA